MQNNSGDLTNTKSASTCCQIEIHFSMQTIKISHEIKFTLFSNFC